jgi:hypothetical protein
MKNPLVFLFFLLIFLNPEFNIAQTMEQVDLNSKNNGIDTSIKDKKNAIGISVGLPGISFGYARKINDRFTARLAYTTLNFNDRIGNQEFSGREVNIDIQLDNQLYGAFLEYKLFKKRNFKLITGLSYIDNLKTSAKIESASGITYGEILIAKEDIGTVFGEAKWKGVAPYAGLGFSKSIPKYAIGYGFELGTHYAGKPDFRFDATRSFLPQVQEEKENKNFRTFVEQFQFFPTIQFNLNFNF